MRDRMRKTILCIPIPNLPLTLAPLGAAGRKKVQAIQKSVAEDDSEEDQRILMETKTRTQMMTSRTPLLIPLEKTWI
jgi:hypothetical protein